MYGHTSRFGGKAHILNKAGYTYCQMENCCNILKLMTNEGKPTCMNCEKVIKEGGHDQTLPSSLRWRTAKSPQPVSKKQAKLLEKRRKRRDKRDRKKARALMAQQQAPQNPALDPQQSQHMAEIVGPTPPQALVPAKESYETLLPQLGPLSKEAHDWMVKVTVKRPGHKAQKYALTPSNGAKWGTPLEQRKCYVQTSKPIVENVVTEDAFDAILTGK